MLRRLAYPNLSPEMAAIVAAEARAIAGSTVEEIRQADGQVTVTVVYDDAMAMPAVAMVAPAAATGGDAAAAVAPLAFDASGAILPSVSPWPHQSDCDAFYGDPRGPDGEVKAAWYAANIVRVRPPWKLVTSWDFAPVTKGIPIHRKCQESLAAVLDAIWQAAAQREAKIREWGMHLYGGGFNYRTMHGSARLSTHAWGCAVDFDTARNAYGDRTPNFARIPQVLDAFAQEGWVWGGLWSTPDGMHWQAARI